MSYEVGWKVLKFNLGLMPDKIKKTNLVSVMSAIEKEFITPREIAVNTVVDQILSPKLVTLPEIRLAEPSVEKAKVKTKGV